MWLQEVDLRFVTGWQAIQLIAFLMFLAAPSASGQALIVTDPNPLARPSPLTAYEIGDAAKVFSAVSKVLADNGFKPVRADSSLGELEETRPDQGNYDKILLWLERDFARPEKSVRLYFTYGRFEKVVGRGEAVRVKASPEDEDKRVGAVKQALLSLSF
jgi:hypothetical protein